MLGGAGSHRRVNGIKSESYSGDINRLSYSHLASLKIEKCENKGDFPGDCQPYLRKCFSYKVSSLNVALCLVLFIRKTGRYSSSSLLSERFCWRVKQLRARLSGHISKLVKGSVLFT